VSDSSLEYISGSEKSNPFVHSRTWQGTVSNEVHGPESAFSQSRHPSTLMVIKLPLPGSQEPAFKPAESSLWLHARFLRDTLQYCPPICT
jgi:hypothetical protein